MLVCCLRFFLFNYKSFDYHRKVEGWFFKNSKDGSMQLASFRECSFFSPGHASSGKIIIGTKDLGSFSHMWQWVLGWILTSSGKVTYPRVDLTGTPRKHRSEESDTDQNDLSSEEDRELQWKLNFKVCTIWSIMRGHSNFVSLEKLSLLEMYMNWLDLMKEIQKEDTAPR